jgi:MoxR-like ATPase
MKLVMFLFLALLAFLLTPGVLVVLPPGGSKTMVAATHAVILSAVYMLTYKFVARLGK